jgi:hypothetical protein
MAGIDLKVSLTFIIISLKNEWRGNFYQFLLKFVNACQRRNAFCVTAATSEVPDIPHGR